MNAACTPFFHRTSEKLLSLTDPMLLRQILFPLLKNWKTNYELRAAHAPFMRQRRNDFIQKARDVNAQVGKPTHSKVQRLTPIGIPNWQCLTHGSLQLSDGNHGNHDDLPYRGTPCLRARRW